MMYPKEFINEIPKEVQKDAIYGLLTLFFEDQARISPEGELAFSKTGLNKLKKLCVELLIEADKAATVSEARLGDFIATTKQNQKKLTVKERAKKAGLHTVSANLPAPKKLILP